MPEATTSRPSCRTPSRRAQPRQRQSSLQCLGRGELFLGIFGGFLGGFLLLFASFLGGFCIFWFLFWLFGWVERRKKNRQLRMIGAKEGSLLHYIF